MTAFIKQLNHRIAATGEEWAEEFAYAQEEFSAWAKKEQIPMEVVERANQAIRDKATEVFDDAYKHCYKLLGESLTEDQAKQLVKFMDSNLGVLLAKVYLIRERAYNPYHTYFQSMIPEIINEVADEWLEENS